MFAEKHFTEQYQFSINRLFIAAILQDNWRRDYGNNRGLLRALQLLCKRKTVNGFLCCSTLLVAKMCTKVENYLSLTAKALYYFSPVCQGGDLLDTALKKALSRNRLYQSRKVFLCYPYYRSHKGQRNWLLFRLSKFIHQTFACIYRCISTDIHIHSIYTFKINLTISTFQLRFSTLIYLILWLHLKRKDVFFHKNWNEVASKKTYCQNLHHHFRWHA